jgi:hypothetical protein
MHSTWAACSEYRPLELVRVRVAPDHQRGAFGNPPIALP